MSRFVKDSKGNYYTTIKSGDCLSTIVYEYCKEFGKPYNGESTWKPIAKINNLKAPNYVIIDGHKLYLTGSATSTSSSSTTTKTNVDRVDITMFGLFASIDKPTLYAGWSNQPKNTDHFEYLWEYTTPDTGSKRWECSGGKGSTNYGECSCTIPDNAVKVYFKVKPVAKTRKDGDKEQPYYTGKWTDITGDGKYKPFDVSKSVPPTKPDAPTIEVDDDDKYKLIVTHTNLDPEELGGNQVEFQVIKDNKSIYATSSKLRLGTTDVPYVTYKVWAADPGAEYKARCRIYNGSLVSEWSDYSSTPAYTPPEKPDGFKECYATQSSVDGKITVYLKWNAVANAASYDIEYATDQSKFDYSDQTTVVNGITTTQRQLDSLDTGFTYYFRMRAVNKNGDVSEWSKISQTTVGVAPAAPTTWSSSTSTTVGGALNLYWVHNSKDGSSQTWAQVGIELYTASTDSAGNTQHTLKWRGQKEIKNSTDFDEKDKTSSLDLTKYLQEEAVGALQWYTDGVQVRWRVRTAGVAKDKNGGSYFGEWSVVRTVDIYAKPTVTISLRDATNTINTTYDTIGSFPICVSATTTPKTQSPIGFFLSIVSQDVYDTVDNAGNDKTVNAGEEVYSRYFDQNGDLGEIALTPSDVDLETGVRYSLRCTAAMDSGLTAESAVDFTVSWEDVSYTPNASIMYDSEKIVTLIRPFCEQYTISFKQVVHDESTDTYSSTDTDIEVVEGHPLTRMYTKAGNEVFLTFSDEGDEIYYYYDSNGLEVTIDESQVARRANVYTSSGEQVYLGCTEITIDLDGNVTGGEDVLYYVSQVGEMVEGVTLAVYRREFDGSYTELGSNIDNTKNTYITDPHPALDYARYRIVATTDATGAISYYDMPAFPIGEKAIIIQWAEDWSYFDAVVDDPPAQPPWSGSMLRLPYNVDVSDSYGVDVSLVTYAGRKRPVTYYGTQLGETSTWNTTVPKDDVDTLYALRRLAIWTGDCYVREPSGTGYWANVGVSFSQKHGDLTIPVTLNITRVEGGA